jgi:translation initiation factor IF-3
MPLTLRRRKFSPASLVCAPNGRNMSPDTNRRQDGWHPVAGSCFCAGRATCARRGARRVQPGLVPEGDPHIATLKKDKEDAIRVNDQIRARQVRVIDENGEQLGILAPRDAWREAEQRGFDLVEVAPKATPPVCRIMDYGKYRYEQKRRARESRKHQHVVTVKEIKFRPKIDEHDFETKKNHVRDFLAEGNKVKVTIMFRGREVAHPEFGRRILVKVVENTADLITGEYRPEDSRLEGRNMSLVLHPVK